MAGPTYGRQLPRRPHPCSVLPCREWPITPVSWVLRLSAFSRDVRGNARFASLISTCLHSACRTVLLAAGKRTTVDVDAVAHDWRTSGECYSPDGCIPENTRDGSRKYESRWSCQGNIIETNIGCRITYYFEEPQDIVKMRIAFHNGRQNTRALKVIVNGDFRSKIEPSGTTNRYQDFAMKTVGTSDVRLYHDDYASRPDEWLSIREVKFMVDE